jgi:hypothetical protein
LSSVSIIPWCTSGEPPNAFTVSQNARSIQAAAVTAAPPQGGRTMTEVSGDVWGAALANGSGRRRRTRAAKEAVRGGDFCKIKNRTKRSQRTLFPIK